MAGLRLYPHRLAAPDSITWYPWWIQRNGGRTDLDSALDGWDYASDETVGISLKIDTPAVLDSTGLDRLDATAVLVLGDCADTQQRLVAQLPLAGQDTSARLDIPLRLPPGQLAGSVQLSAHLVLARVPSPPRGERVASRPGSRLHASPTHTLRLEGDAGRFPTEAISFRETGRGNAPWTLMCIHEDLSDSFMGSIRLLINTDHPIGRGLLDPAGDPALHGLLRSDVIRLLIARVAPEVAESDRVSQEEGSVGQVLDSMCRLFLRRGLTAAVTLYTEDPTEFDVQLHDQLDPLTALAAT